MSIKTNLQLRSCFHARIGLSILSILLACAVIGGAQDAQKGEDPRIAATKQRYGFDQWPGGEARDGLPLDSLRFAGYERTSIDFLPGEPATLRYADDKGQARFLVEVLVCDSTRGARNTLAACLTYISSPRTLPDVARAGVRAGDKGYVGYAPAGAIAWIAFVRGNIFVRVCDLDPRIDPQPPMSLLAERIDAAIKRQPVVKGKEKVSRPSVVLLRQDTAPCKAGDVVPLRLDVKDPAGQAAATVWIVGGTGQGYVEEDEYGVPRLHTTKAGSIRLTCHVLGAKGTIASRSVDIEVAKAR